MPAIDIVFFSVELFEAGLMDSLCGSVEAVPLSPMITAVISSCAALYCVAEVTLCTYSYSSVLRDISSLFRLFTSEILTLSARGLRASGFDVTSLIVVSLSIGLLNTMFGSFTSVLLSSGLMCLLCMSCISTYVYTLIYENNI